MTEGKSEQCSSALGTGPSARSNHAMFPEGEEVFPQQHSLLAQAEQLALGGKAYPLECSAGIGQLRSFGNPKHLPDLCLQRQVC